MSSELPQFIVKLHRILGDLRYESIVSWGPASETVLIKDVLKFANTVLPVYFKHTNMSSFVRQLNKYDFHKLKNGTELKQKYGKNAWEFVNCNFKRDREDLLHLITIKNKTQKAMEDCREGPDFKDSVSNLQKNVSMAVRNITRNFEILQGELKEIKIRLSGAIIPQFKAIVIEDNGLCTTYAMQILSRSNCYAISVESISEFYSTFNHDRFDIVLISNGVPGAIEIIKNIRKKNSKMWIILTVDAGAISDIAIKQYSIINKILYKPYTYEDLLKSIKELEMICNRQMVQ